MSDSIHLSSLKLGYGNKAVIAQLNWHIQVGAVNGLVGMNGAGKTTLLRGIYGMLPLQSGERRFPPNLAHGGNMAFLETENYFYPKMKGHEYLSLFKLQNPGYDPEKWNALFELPLNRLVDEYSTGMKKKLAYMGVLALNRPIVMLDEPFNGVDLESNEKMKLVVEKLREQGKTIIVTSHIIDPLLRLCDHMAILHKGQIAIDVPRAQFGDITRYLEETVSNSAREVIDALFGEN